MYMAVNEDKKSNNVFPSNENVLKVKNYVLYFYLRKFGRKTFNSTTCIFQCSFLDVTDKAKVGNQRKTIHG